MSEKAKIGNKKMKQETCLSEEEKLHMISTSSHISRQLKNKIFEEYEESLFDKQ